MIVSWFGIVVVIVVLYIVVQGLSNPRTRPFVIGLLEKGEIPFRKVGAHRRIPLSPLLEYKCKTAAIRDEALDLLAAQAQELKLY